MPRLSAQDELCVMKNAVCVNHCHTLASPLPQLQRAARGVPRREDGDWGCFRLLRGGLCAMPV